MKIDTGVIMEDLVLVQFSDVQQAARKIRNDIKKTPLKVSHWLKMHVCTYYYRSLPSSL